MSLMNPNESLTHLTTTAKPKRQGRNQVTPDDAGAGRAREAAGAAPTAGPGEQVNRHPVRTLHERLRIALPDAGERIGSTEEVVLAVFSGSGTKGWTKPAYRLGGERLVIQGLRTETPRSPLTKRLLKTDARSTRVGLRAGGNKAVRILLRGTWYRINDDGSIVADVEGNAPAEPQGAAAPDITVEPGAPGAVWVSITTTNLAPGAGPDEEPVTIVAAAPPVVPEEEAPAEVSDEIPAEPEDPRARIESLIDAFTPKTPLARPSAVRAALRNAELRTAFLERVGGLTSAEVATIAGSNARNTSAIASRWRKAGRIFAVTWGDQVLYPVFQFRDGAPHPTIARILAAFAGASDWETAIWFATPSVYLDGRIPMEHLDDPDALEAAVRDELDLPEF
jgi:hypothetical protein